MTQAEFFAWLHALDFITLPSDAPTSPGKGFMEFETPCIIK